MGLHGLWMCVKQREGVSVSMCECEKVGKREMETVASNVSTMQKSTHLIPDI